MTIRCELILSPFAGGGASARPRTATKGLDDAPWCAFSSCVKLSFPMEKPDPDDSASIRSSIEPLRRHTSDAVRPESRDQPPAYSDITGAPSSSYVPPSRSTPSNVPPGLPALDFAAYRPPGSMLTQDQTTLLMPLKKLSSAYDFLIAQAALPPRPLVRIAGQHKGLDTYSWGRSVFNHIHDFDVCFDMMTCFSKSDAGPFDNLVGGPEALRTRLDQFHRDPEINKHFILDRRLAQWDTGFLAGCIRSLLDELQYKGNITMTFPVTHSRVVIENSDHSPPRDSPRVLEKASLRIYDLQTVWCPLDVATGASDGTTKPFMEHWWETWKPTVRHAILSKHKGLVGNEHWMDVAMGSVDTKEPKGPWGKDLW